MEIQPENQKREVGGILPQDNTTNRADELDPQAFILPTKDIHSPLTTPRKEAGILYVQEQSATLPKPPLPAPPVPIVTPEQESTLVVPLQTYQSDMEKYVRKQNVSAVKAAAAEEIRRDRIEKPVIKVEKFEKPAKFQRIQKVESAEAPQPKVAQAPATPPPQKNRSWILHTVAVFAGLILIGGSGAGLYFLYTKTQALPKQESRVAPFISVDETQTISFDSSDTRASAMQKLTQAKKQVALSVGLVAQLLPVDSSLQKTALSPQTFLPAIAPTMPPELVRSVKTDFLIGVHSFDTNQPFIIFNVDSYERGYAGMLDWEKNMREDLSPFFDYNPVPRSMPVASSTASSSAAILESPFSDTILENHDTRTIKNSSGDITLLWTFLDRSTILITTNPNTLREAITRLRRTTQFTLPN